MRDSGDMWSLPRPPPLPVCNAEPLDCDDLQNKSMTAYDGTVAYAKDKRRMVALGERFAKLWAPTGELQWQASMRH